MLAEEFAEPMTIGSITLDPSSPSTNTVTFDEYYVDMGYCSSNELVADFETNYISGTKTNVVSHTGSVTFNASDLTVVLQDEFFFDPANGNLIIEINWPDGEDEIYNFNFGTTYVSAVSAGYQLPHGDLYYDMPHLFINGVNTFDQTTFAGIKATFR